MNSFGLYIHIPYCIKKCPYCDFNSYGVGKDPVLPEKEYSAALVAELAYYAKQAIWKNREIHSIFFGGGTPSLFSSKQIAFIINSAKNIFNFSPQIEITLEANPGTIDEKLAVNKLSEFGNAGVNRISMGVQSFQEEKLKFLGRIHSQEDTFKAVENIKQAGFSNFNLDLIFGVAGETKDNWKKDLNTALTLESPHLSCYCLTIEPGTEFGRLNKKGELKILSEDTQGELFCFTQETLTENQFVQYEISNYSKIGKECQHNLGYWSGLDYLGLGAGAHSYCKSNLDHPDELAYRWNNIPGPEDYIKLVNTRGDASSKKETIDKEKARLEYLYLSFRTKQGLNIDFYQKKFNSTIDANTIKNLCQQNLIMQVENKLITTDYGFLFVDEILRQTI